MSFMAKFLVEGPDAGASLARISAGDVDGAPETITYTQWLNERGLIEADLTVTKHDADSFMVVASDTAHGAALDWLNRHLHGEVTVTDVTAKLAQINLQGPLSRDVLAGLTDQDLSTAAFPFRTARVIPMVAGGGPARPGRRRVGGCGIRTATGLARGEDLPCPAEQA